MNGVENIASVISCGIMDLQYDGFGCQNMKIVHFHEYVQESEEGTQCKRLKMASLKSFCKNTAHILKKKLASRRRLKSLYEKG